MWLAVDRDRNKVIDITVSSCREKWVYVEIAERLEKLGYEVAILCTDGYEGYGYYQLGKRHVITKSETALVESKNSLIRHYLARFNRRTKRYSKSIHMITASLLMLFHKTLLLSILI